MKVFDEVRAKLENWKKYNDKCLVKAEKRNDFDAMNYFRALNFAVDRANGFMDDVEEMQSNEKEKEKDNRKPQTNIDRIRTMSEEELAAVIMCPYDLDETSFGEKIPCYQNGRQELVTEEECHKCCVNWLKSEAYVEKLMDEVKGEYQKGNRLG